MDVITAGFVALGGCLCDLDVPLLCQFVDQVERPASRPEWSHLVGASVIWLCHYFANCVDQVERPASRPEWSHLVGALSSGNNVGTLLGRTAVSGWHD